MNMKLTQQIVLNVITKYIVRDEMDNHVLLLLTTLCFQTL